MVRTADRARLLSFAGRGSDPDGRIVSFEWFFGDGRSALGRRVSHTFKIPGSYRVMLRATDSWGNWAYAGRTVSGARELRRAQSGRPPPPPTNRAWATAR